jgi:uncharacterized protein (DUF697 family)/pimeloyl-ACP methyl ester carboxylesterase
MSMAGISGENSAQDSVVLVHGFFRTRADMGYLADYLGARGYRVWLPELSATLGSLERCSEQLADKLKAIDAGDGAIHFVGHSFGGLIVRHYLSRHRLPGLGRCVLIAAPNRGSGLANKALALLRPWPVQPFRSLEDLRVDALALGEPLNEPAPDIGIIAGNRCNLLLGRLLAGANDGRVAVEATRFAGMKDFAVLPYGHHEIHRNAETAGMTLRFLETGHFRDAGETAANAQTIAGPDGTGPMDIDAQGTREPDPETLAINPLEKCMTTETVVTDLEEKLTVAAQAERLARADNLVKNYVLVAVVLGAVPVPLADLAGVMALQVKLVHGLAKHYEVPFKQNLARSLVASLVSGAASMIGFAGLASIGKGIPVLGVLAGGGGVAVTAGAVTYAVGQVFARHFESGGTLLDFDPHKVKSMFKVELKKGKVAAAEASEAPKEQAPAAPAAA